MNSDKIGFDFTKTGTLKIKFIGDWRISSSLPAVSEVTSQLRERADIRHIIFDLSQMTNWDSGLTSFLFGLIKECRYRKIDVALQTLPQGVQKMLEIALKVGEQARIERKPPEPFFTRIGERVTQISKGMRVLLDFLGEIASAFGRLFSGRAYFRRDDFMAVVQGCGADALGLVSLISVLVGMILAFVGAIQLQMFGAQIFIANIVGISMVRFMGAVMTGVLMAGRTGASFAAELGIMRTNEEIDALTTLGVNPVEFLVMPRVLALVIMMPLLALYADLMGIVGGFVIGVGILGINPIEYLNHTRAAVTLNHVWVGLIHSFVFGILIAVAGCLRGIRCQRSASGVGEATTSAVVSAIISIVIATAIITFICQMIGV